MKLLQVSILLFLGKIVNEVPENWVEVIDVSEYQWAFHFNRTINNAFHFISTDTFINYEYIKFSNKQSIPRLEVEGYTFSFVKYQRWYWWEMNIWDTLTKSPSILSLVKMKLVDTKKLENKSSQLTSKFLMKSHLSRRQTKSTM